MADLTTLEAAKRYANVVNSSDDDLLQSLIEAYSQWIRSYCNRNFDLGSYLVTRSGRGGTVMLLPQYPIVTIVALMIDGVAIPAQSRFGGYGYRFDERTLYLDGTCFAIGAGNVSVSFTAGYPTIPADIAQAVNEAVALRYKTIDKIGWTSKSLAGETVAIDVKDMPMSVKTVLNQYRNVVPA